MVLQLAVSRGLKALGLLREQTMLTPECNLQVTAKNAALKRQCNATVDLRSSFLPAARDAISLRLLPPGKKWSPEWDTEMFRNGRQIE